MLKAVLFDFDGVIINSEPITSEVIGKILREYGKTPKLMSHGLYQPIGKRGEDIWPVFMEEYGFKEDINVLIDKVRMYKKQITDVNPPALLDGVEKLIKVLKAHNIKLALVTGSATSAVSTLKRYNLLTSFDELILGPDVKKGKPDPQGYLLAMERLGVKPEESIVIEDALPGVIAGKRAGAKVIAASSIYAKGEDFSQADLRVNSLSAITWEIIASM